MEFLAKNQYKISEIIMFSPLIFMLLTIVTVFGIGLFIAYGKDKGWNKPQSNNKK